MNTIYKQRFNKYINLKIATKKKKNLKKWNEHQSWKKKQNEIDTLQIRKVLHPTFDVRFEWSKTYFWYSIYIINMNLNCRSASWCSFRSLNCDFIAPFWVFSISHRICGILQHSFYSRAFFSNSKSTIKSTMWSHYASYYCAANQCQLIQSIQ